MMNEKVLKKYSNQIRTILEDKDSVIFAYLFGSSVTKTFTPMSDIDIAVYLSPNVNKSEEQLDLIGSLMLILKTDNIDLVILNTAPLTLKARIILNKEILIDKSPFLRHSFESLVLRQHYDFSIKETNIFERRFSLERHRSDKMTRFCSDKLSHLLTVQIIYRIL